MHPIAIAAYVALFALTGFLFLFANLVVGWLVRPRLPNRGKTGSVRVRRADDRLELRAI